MAAVRIVYDRFHFATEPIDLPSAAADVLDKPDRWQWPLAVRWYLQGRADNEREWIELLAAVAAEGWQSVKALAKAKAKP